MPKILGVKFSNLTNKEALEEALKLLSTGKQHYIVTPNPEILLKAHKNPKYKKILNQASISIPDGAGIIWAAKKQKTPLKERVTGVDLMQAICKNAKEDIFLLGAAPGIAQKAAKKLKLNPKNTHSGSPKTSQEKEIVEKINNSQAKILFVAFGAPSQEIWIKRNLKKMPNIGLAIGVGGSFDFIAGKQKRAPKWMQKFQLEWLYRLIRQPKRLLRIINATIVFPITFLRNKN